MNSLNRRQFLGSALAGVCLSTGTSWASPGRASTPDGPLNVLHLISDDLGTRLSCYDEPLVRTPHIDALAARGVRFDRAYCQFPLCNPSRASFMTGLRPDTLRVYENQTHFRETVHDAVTIPQSFHKAGYFVARVGKIYHYGVPSQIGTSGLDDPESWEQVVNPKGRDIDDIGMVEVLQLAPDGTATTATGKKLTDTGGTLSWLAAEGGDSEQTDGKGAAAAIQLLEACAKNARPFYLAVGFYRPHTPFIAPKSYFAQYLRDEITVPEVPPDLAMRFPAAALSRQKPAEVAMSDALRRQAIQAYYASTTFMDAQVGHVLAALEELDLANNTIVVFHSDHGYHLGEKNLWQKMSVYEESARVPLVISVPGNRNGGRACARPVEIVSLHKTLTDLCGIAAGPKTEGHSMRPLVENPRAEWEHAAFSQVTRGGRAGGSAGAPQIMGRSVRTQRWRYTEWDEGRAGAELFDHAHDPMEMSNLAGAARFRQQETELRVLLRAGGV
ncbi:MAG: sulfatase [Candidatus Hydrogenedentes bacterium]|nr:sulfatase [Candidatus Hydrogenedentota bacterium]